MTSELKPRTRAKKKANYRFYLVGSLLLCTLYYLLSTSRGGSGDDGARVDATQASLPSNFGAGKLESAASVITKGISGTSRDKSKVANEASDSDKETHALVHELKKQAEGEPPSETMAAPDPAIGTEDEVAESWLTTGHGPTGAKEVTVQPTLKDSGRATKNKAFDAADSLEVLLESYEMIVFSKSYCPHSKRAKAILEFYDIRPRPLVYELDQEEHGGDLQKALGRLTGRTTVPNVMVHGQSIGGGDELAALDKSDQLVRTLPSSCNVTDMYRSSRSGH